MAITDNLIKSSSYDNVIPKKWIPELNLFKPLWYHGREEDAEKGISLSYYSAWRNNKGFKNLLSWLNSKEASLRINHCKNDGSYIVGAGTLFKKQGNDTYISLMVTCETEDKTVILLNPLINEIKGLKKGIKMILEKSSDFDIIWSKNIDQYCFNTFPKVRFSSFISQRKYYQHIADEWVLNERIKNQPEIKQKVEETVSV